MVSLVVDRQREDLVERVADPLGVLAVLHDRAERGRRGLEVELAAAQRVQRARPVERLGDAGRLDQVVAARSTPVARATCSASAAETSGSRRRTISISRARPGWSTQW